MATFVCKKCTKIFDKKSALTSHEKRKTSCILIEEERKMKRKMKRLSLIHI